MDVSVLDEKVNYVWGHQIWKIGKNQRENSAQNFLVVVMQTDF